MILREMRESRISHENIWWYYLMNVVSLWSTHNRVLTITEDAIKNIANQNIEKLKFNKEKEYENLTDNVIK